MGNWNRMLACAAAAMCITIMPLTALATKYDDSWQGIIAEDVYPWGSRVWEKWERVKPNKKIKVGISIPSLNSPYFVNQSYGFLTEAKATGVGVTILAANGYEDIQGQISQVENMIQKGIDALVIAPTSAEALTMVSEEAADKGIPVYFIGEAAITDKLKGYICENDFDFGFKGIEWIGKKLAGKGKIAILAGPAGSTYTEAINKGAHTALKDFPGIEVVAEKWGESEDPAVGQSIAENIMNAHPDINAFFVVEAQAHGVANALIEAGKTDKIDVVMAYPFQATIPYIKNGSIDYGVTGHSLSNARILLNMIVRNSNEENQVPKYVWTAGLSMEKETIDQFPKNHVWAPEGWEPPSSMVLEPR